MSDKTPIYGIIGRWDKRADLADDLREITGRAISTDMVHKWAKNGVIPAEWHFAVLKSAKRREISLTADELAVAHYQEKGAA